MIRGKKGRDEGAEESEAGERRTDSGDTRGRDNGGPSRNHGCNPPAGAGEVCDVCGDVGSGSRVMSDHDRATPRHGDAGRGGVAPGAGPHSVVRAGPATGIQSARQRVYGIEDMAEESTNLIMVKLASDMGVPITEQDLSVRHRMGRKSTGKPRPIIAKFVRRDTKTRMMRAKKELRGLSGNRNVYINDDLTSL